MPDLLGDFSYTWPWYAAGLFAYLLGSIPFGVILTKLAGAGDLRQIGSGNIGATNVLRTGNKLLALLTFLLDLGKGAGAIAVAGIYGPDFCVIAALMVVLGHMFPVWLLFRGGKGVATAFGAILGLSWPIGLACMAIWLVMALLFRISSLSALVAVPAAPILLSLTLSMQRSGDVPMWLPGEPQFVWVLWPIAVIVVLRHWQNIRRLLAGKEPRIGESNAANPSSDS